VTDVEAVGNGETVLKYLARMALSTGILRFCDRELPRPRSVEERDPSRS